MQTIDIHTHGIGGFDTSQKHPEAILKIAELQGTHGVMAIIPTIYPAPIHVMRENMEAVKKAMALQGLAQSKKLSLDSLSAIGADDMAATSYKKGLKRTTPVIKHLNPPSRIIGVNLEGPFLNPVRCGALNNDAFLMPDIRIFRELIDGFEDIVKIITVAPELEGALKIIKHARDIGINVSMGHSDATYAEAESGYNAGAVCITHIFNAMRGMHHREPGIAGFGLLHEKMYVEVVADPYHLHTETIKMIFSIKKPEHIIVISDSIKDTKLAEFSGDKQKRIDGKGFNYERTDIQNSKHKTALACGTGLLCGGLMTITESTQRLIDMGIDENIVMRCITENPSSYLKMGSMRSISTT